jgi:hypothetical protein
MKFAMRTAAKRVIYQTAREVLYIAVKFSGEPRNTESSQPALVSFFRRGNAERCGLSPGHLGGLFLGYTAFPARVQKHGTVDYRGQ